MKPPLERNPTKKRHSWWWDSHISPKNSKWLAENLEEMDKQVKEMLQLIEEDGDSFAKKAQMYYQKRPMLITHVESFYRMYRALAERYDNVTGELRRNVRSGLQSQGYSSMSDSGSELPRSPSPSPEPESRQRVPTRESSPRPAGFDFFLGNKNNSPVSRKESEDFVSQSGSDIKSDDGEEDGIAYTLHQRVLELEDELHAANEKLEALEEKSSRCQCGHKENGGVSDQSFRVSELESKKQQSSREEITDLRNSLKDGMLSSEEYSKLAARNQELEADMSATLHEIDILKKEMASAKKQFEDGLSRRDVEISKYKQELADADGKFSQAKSNETEVAKLQELIDNLKYEMDKVSQEKSRLQGRVGELEQVADEADKCKQVLAGASERLLQEKAIHEAEIAKLQRSVEDMKSEIENVSRQKSLLKAWFAELEQAVERGSHLCRE